ncbi:MAG: DUF1992 domain-containing protein [bacterium]
MQALAWIAEQRIKEAIESGELDNLPGMGRPLQLDDEFAKNSETRVAFTILKNAGFLPFPLLLRKQIEHKFIEAEKLLENCRLRTNYILDLIVKVWCDISQYFPDPRSLMTHLNLEYCPDNFKIENAPGAGCSSKLKKNKMSVKNSNIVHLINSYNESIKNYRKRYLELLDKTNEKISELRFECLKEEIRKGRIVLSPQEMGFLDIQKRVEKFDSEFQMFLFSSNEL